MSEPSPLPDAVRWDYWCPPEGEHVYHRNELHVGLFSDAGGCGVLILRVAVIPPIVDRWNGMAVQPEPLARIVRDAMRSADLTYLRHQLGSAFPLPPRVKVAE